MKCKRCLLLVLMSLMVFLFVGCGKKGANEDGIKKGELPYGFVWGQKTDTVYETLKSEVGEEKIRIEQSSDGSKTTFELKDGAILGKDFDRFDFYLKNESLESVYVGYNFEDDESAQSFYSEIVNMFNKLGEGEENDGYYGLEYKLELADTKYNIELGDKHIWLSWGEIEK